MIEALHTEMMATVNVGGEVSESFRVTNGVKQGCVLAPTLFSIFLSAMLDNAFRDLGDGIYIQSRQSADLFNVAHFRAKTKTTRILMRELLFADDSALVAHSAEEMQKIVDAFSNASKKFGLNINIKKTEVLYQPNSTRTREEDIMVDGNKVNSVMEFTYLGSTISSDGCIDDEIQRRMAKASASFGRLHQRLWNNHHVSMRVKGKKYRAIVLSTLLYGAEAWTVYRRQVKKLHAFLMRHLRSIMRITWMDKVTNKEILERTGLPSMEDLLIRKNLRWTGHLMRMSSDRLPKQVLYSQLSSGHRKRGRPRLRFKDTIKRNVKLRDIKIDSWTSQGKRSKKKHLSKEASRKIKYKQMMWKTYRHTGSEEDYAIYKEALNQATAEIRNSKRSYEQKIAFNIKHDSKSFYAYVRSKQKVQDKVGPLEGSDGNIITEGFLMAENLNEYFSTVFTREDISTLPVLETKFEGRECDYLGQLTVTPKMVAMKIRDMKDNKSPGVDGIPPKLLLEIVEQISIPLATVFNLALEEGVVPVEWKEANIIPLFKKGSRSKSENYRPVSLTSVICKLLERLIKDHLVDFLVKNKLINTSQHGFLKARSCLTNMLCFLEDVTKWVDEGSPVDIIYLDFKKAFDKVPHQRLLLKLKAHGIGNSMINWIEKWLIDRRQRVVVDGEVSNWKSVLSGVPQGSVLGPILFLIYINDLDDDITSKVLKFADDTKVFRKIKSDADRQHLQDDLNKLIEWSEKWQMLFNFGKCKCLHTGHGNENAQYTMGGTELNTTVKEKDLGLTISADMKVSEQCGIAAAKANQILGLIRRNIVYKEKELIIPLYKTIVRPHLEYCIQAWRPYRKKDIDMLERVQRRATKMIPKLRNISYEMRLKECGLTTLETRRLRGDQIEVFKILNGYENIDRNIFFTVKEERRTRGHGVALAKKQCRLDIRKFSFSQRIVNEWNKLSADCVGARSVNMFKNKIDIYLRRAGYT